MQRGGPYHNSAVFFFFCLHIFFGITDMQMLLGYGTLVSPEVPWGKEGAETITPLYIRRVPLKRLTHCCLQ